MFIFASETWIFLVTFDTILIKARTFSALALRIWIVGISAGETFTFYLTFKAVLVKWWALGADTLLNILSLIDTSKALVFSVTGFAFLIKRSTRRTFTILVDKTLFVNALRAGCWVITDQTSGQIIKTFKALIHIRIILLLTQIANCNSWINFSIACHTV